MDDINWRKSRRSLGEANTNCVELGDLTDGTVGVRDSKAPHFGNLTIGRVHFRKLIETVKSGALDL